MELTLNEKNALGFARRAAKATDEADRAWHLRAALRYAGRAGLTLEVIEAKAAALEGEATVAPQAPEKPKCCHVRVIHRFYAIAKKVGLKVEEEDRMRGAVSMALGRRIESRESLTAENWILLGDWAESGRLIW